MRRAALTSGSRMRSTSMSRPIATTRATMTAMARLRRASPLANCTLFARKALTTVKQQGPGSGTVVLAWAFGLERVTGIEPALSAWELACHASLTSTLQVRRHLWLSASVRRVPVSTPLSGTQRARQRLPQVGGDHQTRRDIQPCPLPAHSDADLLKYASTMRSEWRR